MYSTSLVHQHCFVIQDSRHNSSRNEYTAPSPPLDKIHLPFSLNLPGDSPRTTTADNFSSHPHLLDNYYPSEKLLYREITLYLNVTPKSNQPRTTYIAMRAYSGSVPGIIVRTVLQYGAVFRGYIVRGYRGSCSME